MIQYQSFSRAFQAPPTHSGGVIDFDRDFYGIDANWRAVHSWPAATCAPPWDWNGRSVDARQGYENFVGDTFGVKGGCGATRRTRSPAPIPTCRLEWERGDGCFSGGVRHSRVKFDVKDRYPGKRRRQRRVDYRHTTPLAGVLYKLSPALNMYASAARGFEAPTLNEVFYSGAGGGFNFQLDPAVGTHLEAGVKAMLPPGVPRQRGPVPGAHEGRAGGRQLVRRAHQLPQRQRDPAPGRRTVARRGVRRRLERAPGAHCAEGRL